MGGGFPKLQNDIKSKVELNPFEAKHYDLLLNTLSLGIYPSFTKRAVDKIDFAKEESILDLGSGTGRFSCLFHRKTKIKTYTGIDLSEIMIKQARKKCRNYPDAKFIQGNIREKLPFNENFTKTFISFVLHGFIQKDREKIAENAYSALKDNGEFIILDYAEKNVESAPFYIKFLIRKLECPLAEEFMKMDLKKMLKEIGFREFKEYFFLDKYVRLEVATK